MVEEFLYPAKFNPEPEGGYTVIFPALRGIVTYGKSLEEAENSAKEALALHLESLLARKKPLPKDKKERLSTNAFLVFHGKLIAGKEECSTELLLDSWESIVMSF